MKASTSKDLQPGQRNNEFLLHLHRQMLTIREFEDQVRDLYTRTTVSGVAHFSTGQEAVPVGVCAALLLDDYITSTHRGHGHCLAKGADLGRMFAELLGKVDGHCRGKGGSMHIANQDAGNLGANGIVGGSIPIATGAALSAKFRRSKQVSACFFGDGALNQGILFESINLAAIWQLPVIFVCENNQYGEFTAMERVTAGKAHKRGEAFGIPSAIVDGMDVLAVYEATLKAVRLARSGKGPSFLVFDTYRYYGHGMSDPNRPYRSREEEREWREQRDPIDRLAKQLIEAGKVTRGDLDSIQEAVQQEIRAAIEFAKKSPLPDPQEVTKHVYAD